jgi:hypothetical protein
MAPVDFSEALAAVQGWIGTAVSVSCVVADVEVVRATGVIDTPELLRAEEDGEEYWIFPLVGNVGAFSLSRPAFHGARWDIADLRLRIELDAAALDVELA